MSNVIESIPWKDLFTLGGGKGEKSQGQQEHKDEHKEIITPTIPNYTSTRVTTQDPQVTSTIKGKIQWQSSSQIQRKRGLGGR